MGKVAKSLLAVLVLGQVALAAAAAAAAPPWLRVTAVVVALVGLVVVSLVALKVPILRPPTQRQLEASQRATKLATDMNTKFVRALAHDLREPIRGVNNFVDLLLDHDIDKKSQRELLERIRAAATRAHDQLIELRAFALDQNGEGGDPLSKLALGALVEEAVESLDKRVVDQGAFLSLDLDARTLDAKYTSAFRRVIVNLVENALKYAGSPQEPPQIVIRTTKTECGEIEIRVEDDGPGFRREDVQRIFEPYERLSEHEHTKPGLGIGLSICREIVQQMRGRIWALPHGQDGVEGGVVVVRLPIPSHAAPAARRG